MRAFVSAVWERESGGYDVAGWFGGVSLEANDPRTMLSPLMEEGKEGNPMG